ncbi:Ger(x)C family spore germination protein [Clostridium sp. BNL1100]|uniref:Ger(x)C family spore germination protein n=1 Tax=Clostridium sp. BNL1100 TaxID=755731 RepID=UPI00024A7D51|nr:Ger(x)C family spore germination protein [Clostridium sp. BNL1100]AEY68028.1 germination protein, Ger(X)C family [Clostridium sp. BNL1100]
MKKLKFVIMASIIFINLIITAGCWNYRELDKLAIVAGAAIDKDSDGLYIVTAEIVQVGGGVETKSTPKLVSMNGKTVLDAIRNGISTTGKKLYWSHCKVVILSKDVAEEGITKFIDVFVRDAEIRDDVNILYSQQDTAKEIFEGEEITESIKSFALEDIIKNQNSLSKAPKMDILNFSIERQTKGISTVIPTVHLEEINGSIVPKVIGTAIIKNDKIAGELSGDETKFLLFIRDQLKGGVLVEQKGENISAPVSLEIFGNKTKVKPVVEAGKLKFRIDIKTSVGVDEVEGNENFIEEKAVSELEAGASESTKENITGLIKKIQSEYGADVFKFGEKLRENNIKEWNRVSDKWDDVFRDLEVDVNVKVRIKNSSILVKTLKKGG